MTTPTTRAELIALMAKAIEEHMFAPHELPLDAELHTKYLDNAAGALAAIEAAGCRVVPEQPTTEMLDTMDDWIGLNRHECYLEVLEASPFGPPAA